MEMLLFRLREECDAAAPLLHILEALEAVRGRVRRVADAIPKAMDGLLGLPGENEDIRELIEKAVATLEAKPEKWKRMQTFLELEERKAEVEDTKRRREETVEGVTIKKARGKGTP